MREAAARAPREAATVAALALGLVAVHLAYGGLVELVEDEAYYWVWSRRLAAGYLDHPPAVAWLIRAGTELLGDTERGVRAGAALLGGLALWPLARASARPVLAAATAATLPLFLLGGLFATPDVPLLAAWALGLWAALEERWAVLGVAAGLAMLSKYTGLLLLPLVVAARPGDLRTRGPWLAAALALLVYSPNLLWNLAQDGVSWRFQLAHVADSSGSLALLAAQVGLAGPVIFGACCVAWGLGWRALLGGAPRREAVLWWTSLPVLLLAVVTGGEANWAAPAWLGGLLLLAERGGRLARAAWLGLGINATLGGLVLVHGLYPLVQLPQDPTDRLHGGRVLGESVAAWGVSEVVTSRYQEAALIHFYGGVPARSLPDWDRLDQYDLWGGELPPAGLFVRVWRGSTRTAVDMLGYERSGPNVVSAYVNVPGEVLARPVARWQVYEYWSPDGAPPEPGAADPGDPP